MLYDFDTICFTRVFGGEISIYLGLIYGKTHFSEFSCDNSEIMGPGLKSRN